MNAHRTIVTTLVLFTLVVSAAAPVQGGQGAAGTPANLAEEVKALRLELVEERIERQREKVAKLERGLARMGSDRQRAEQGYEALGVEVTQIDERLGDPTLGEEERAGLEATKVELVETSLARSRAERKALSQREQRLSSQLSAERERLRTLLEREKVLRSVGSSR
jgi:hypothetical protein